MSRWSGEFLGICWKKALSRQNKSLYKGPEARKSLVNLRIERRLSLLRVWDGSMGGDEARKMGEGWMGHSAYLILSPLFQASPKCYSLVELPGPAAMQFLNCSSIF